MNKIALAAATVVFAGFAFAVTHSESDTDLRRVDCSEITVFAPKNSASASDLCRSYGGLAQTDAAPSDEGLVILVRNQPMGGFDGQSSVQ